ncbi:MAG: hypothetical protein FWD48_09285 [Oscillospiraceae bacterium]|nr:hypothetical protein [Oscillospiraceae bacterium]
MTDTQMIIPMLLILAVILLVLFIVALKNSGGKKLSGTWEGICNGTGVDYVFFGNSFTFTNIGEIRSGTYIIAGNQIEFTYSDDSTSVKSFFRTENTITMDGVRYTRKPKEIKQT